MLFLWGLASQMALAFLEGKDATFYGVNFTK
jgi:hypothetical protein